MTQTQDSQLWCTAHGHVMLLTLVVPYCSGVAFPFSVLLAGLRIAESQRTGSQSLQNGWPSEPETGRRSIRTEVEERLLARIHYQYPTAVGQHGGRWRCKFFESEPVVTCPYLSIPQMQRYFFLMIWDMIMNHAMNNLNNIIYYNIRNIISISVPGSLFHCTDSGTDWNWFWNCTDTDIVLAPVGYFAYDF